MIKKTREVLSGCLAGIVLLIVFHSRLEARDTIPLPDTNRLVVVFAGDIMGHDGQINGAWDETTGKYNYEPTFRYIKDYLSEADIAVGNFEVTLAGPPYKGYPQFSSPDELALEAKSAGFDVMAMANNHALDGGEKGFLRTINMMDSIGFFHMGTYRDSAERANYYPLILDKDSFRLAMLNFTYGTNGLKISAPYHINRIDTNQIKADIQKAKLTNPDFIIAFVHWGVEYERVENIQQRILANFLLKHGTDIIIGSHPHVVQPVRFYCHMGDSGQRFPVVYSLGNFVSNQRDQYRDGGIIAEFHVSKVNGIKSIDSLNYLPYWVWKEVKPNGRYTFYVLPIQRFELEPEAYKLSDNDIVLLKRFAEDTRKHIEVIKESSYYLKKQKLQ